MNTAIYDISGKAAATNIYPHLSNVSRDQRNQHFGHQSGVLWLTGLSGAGKSTIATLVEKILFREGYLISVLDGDTLRSGLNIDLGFTIEDRAENLRRTGEVASILSKSGHIVLASFISPHNKGRESVKNIIGENFHLVHIHAELDDCISRDPKGLYKKALFGGIENFTGIDQEYELPEAADLVINTSLSSIAECSLQLTSYIKSNFVL
jgi:bifunctional enzyme CysN/CysC